MIHIWYTEHEISQRVLGAVAAGLRRAGTLMQAMRCEGAQAVPKGSHICYGVLRGCDAVLKASDGMEWPWYHIDNGYFRPGHFNGYYRISRGNTQAHYAPAQAANGERWQRLGLEMAPWQRNAWGHVLICPPTPAMGSFFGFDTDKWLADTLAALAGSSARPLVVRHKQALQPLEEDLKGAYAVVTFNSSVAWQALLQGIPAIADGACIVRSWNNFTFSDIESDLTACDRQALFHCFANNQFTLQEFAEQPQLWLSAVDSQLPWPSLLRDRAFRGLPGQTPIKSIAK